MNKDDPCNQYSSLLNIRKGLNKSISGKNAECEEMKFGSIQKYFNEEEEKTTSIYYWTFGFIFK